MGRPGGAREKFQYCAFRILSALIQLGQFWVAYFKIKQNQNLTTLVCDLWKQTIPEKTITSIMLSSPRGARAFHELRRYHTRPLQLNWGPENVNFGKTHSIELLM